AADPFDVGADHVHADPATGDVGDLGGGGEAGPEDQVDQVLGLHPGCRLAGDHSTAYGDLGDLGGVDALAVVGDLDDHLAALVAGLQQQPAARGPALGDPVLRPLDAVVQGVADQVGQRSLEGFEQG